MGGQVIVGVTDRVGSRVLLEVLVNLESQGEEGSQAIRVIRELQATMAFQATQEKMD